MSAHDSAARLKASRVQPDYWRWKGPDLAPFFELVAKLGADAVEIRAVPGLNERGEPDLHLVVLNAATGEELGAYNYSYPCPPWCD